MFICYNYAFWNDCQKRTHIFSNVGSILTNIQNYEKKYIYSEKVSLKLHSKNLSGFLAGDIWVLRAMYDKFLLNTNKRDDELFVQHNMILGCAIINKLEVLENKYNYNTELHSLKTDVKKSYYDNYGYEEPKLDYFGLSNEFLER